MQAARKLGLGVLGAGLHVFNVPSYLSNGIWWDGLLGGGVIVQIVIAVVGTALILTSVIMLALPNRKETPQQRFRRIYLDIRWLAGRIARDGVFRGGIPSDDIRFRGIQAELVDLEIPFDPEAAFCYQFLVDLAVLSKRGTLEPARTLWLYYVSKEIKPSAIEAS